LNREGVIRVFLLDDHEVVRRGVQQLLDAEDDIEVVGEAGSVERALARLPAVRPDVAILDVRLPDGDGVTVCREIRSRFDDIACIMLTSFSDDDALLQAIVAGASGYLLKQIRGTDIVDAVRRVAAGDSLLDPTLVERVSDRLKFPPPEDERLACLTAQERRILTLIADGLASCRGPARDRSGRGHRPVSRDARWPDAPAKALHAVGSVVLERTERPVVVVGPGSSAVSLGTDVVVAVDGDRHGVRAGSARPRQSPSLHQGARSGRRTGRLREIGPGSRGGLPVRGRRRGDRRPGGCG
jgi:DNA-binding NarL/FixJ family response regulator